MMMNTDFHFKLSCMEEEEDQLGLLLGELRGAYRAYTFHEWSSELWKMTLAASADMYNENTENQPEQDFRDFVSKLKELVKAAWNALQLKKRSDFKHEYLGMVWKANPYAIVEEKLHDVDRYRTSYLRGHNGKITSLTQDEVRDFFLVFESFFQQLDIIAWLKLLDIWLDYSKSKSSIVSDGYDYAPLETHRQLLRLVEGCYLADDFGFCPTYYPPNNHFFYRDYTMLELYSETYDGYNPFLQLRWIFTEYSLLELREAFLHWMDCAKNKEKIYTQNEPATLILLCSNMCKLLEIGWLILHTQEMPQHWLHPKTFDPDGENSQVNIQEESCVYLNKKEQLNLEKALRKFYKKHSWYHYQRMKLNDALYHALYTKEKYYQIEIFNKLEKSMGKLMEILYLVNREFHLK